MTKWRVSYLVLVIGLLCMAHGAYAQFSGAVTGTVLDPSGAVVPNAHLTLHNKATGADRTATSSAEGVYQFLSLAPGNYELSTTITGFSASKVALTLETNQNLNVPVNLALGSGSQTVNVTSQAPLLDNADTRLQETLSTQTLSQLPLAGRSMISLVTLAPGVTGTGVTSNGSPGSGRDNFSTETQVDASANGQGAVGNMYIVDGLDVTSSIRAGVLNLTPNPDSIQETSIQTNTYNVDYGRASSIQMTMTTKSGGSSYHGNASDYFTYQKWAAGTEFSHTYAPFHSNNISATIGGPIIPKHNAGFFFFAIEPLRSSAGLTGQVSFEDPAFVAFANQNFPNSLGTKLMNTYKVANVSGVKVSTLASAAFPGTCGTAAAFNLPCSTPLTDTANWSDSQYRNGLQYSIRLDKAFGKDRLYGSYLRNTLSSNAANLRPAFNTTDQYYSWGIQINETHTFNPNMLNEAAFAADRVEGIAPQTGLFSVPTVNVTGIGNGFGAGFATGDFIQQNYHWRDVLTYAIHSHDIRAGFEGLFATDVEVFNGPYDQPSFAFNSLLDLARDAPNTEGNLSYDPVSGQRTQYGWDAAGITHGIFVQDTWKISQRVTLNYGVRWDDFGNPYQRSPSTQFANFFYGPGATAQQQVANGFVVAHHHALNRSITDIFSPRAGVAWDPTGNGKWLIRGGAGIFHNWPTLANLQEEYRGNPPGNIFPTFFAGGTPSPIFALGTSNTKPFGYPAPVLPAQPLNAQGGLPGTQFTIGGIDANLRSPVSYVYSASIDRELGRRLVGTLAYSGAKGELLLSGGGAVYNVNYGQDINAFNNDIVQNGNISPTRLNHSFGQVVYTQNNRESNYNAFIAAIRGRFNHAFFNASYTHSVSKDDTQVYPAEYDPHQFYGPSIWDAPDRFSLAWNYEIPGLNDGKGLVGRVTAGWQLSGTTIIQSGNPINVYNSAAFQPLLGSDGKTPLKNPNGSFVGAAPGSGDYNADGDTGTNLDYPNVTSYNYKTTRHDYLNGIFTSGQFTTPTLGTEGNEKYNSFRGPYFQQWDMSLLKTTQIAESVAFQFRFEFFNIFNHPNLNNVVTDLSNAGSFGKATGQSTPRFFQIGGNLTF